LSENLEFVEDRVELIVDANEAQTPIFGQGSGVKKRHHETWKRTRKCFTYMYRLYWTSEGVSS
jgi:hypothetical protein